MCLCLCAFVLWLCFVCNLTCDVAWFVFVCVLCVCLFLMRLCVLFAMYGEMLYGVCDVCFCWSMCVCCCC